MTNIAHPIVSLCGRAQYPGCSNPANQNQSSRNFGVGDSTAIYSTAGDSADVGGAVFCVRAVM
jgi:hypothetical protein